MYGIYHGIWYVYISASVSDLIGKTPVYLNLVHFSLSALTS